MRTSILHVVADDERLVEVAPVLAALERRGAFRQVVVHAGRPPEHAPVDSELGRVHRWLHMNGGTPSERTAAMLTAFDSVLLEEQPDLVLVTGDDEPALGAALAAAKRAVAVVHLGAGLRSWDWTLSEEINRSVIDRLSDTLFTYAPEADENLLQEGIPSGRIIGVGNTRIDVLRRYESLARKRAAWSAYGARERDYTLVALRQSEPFARPGHLEQLTSALDTLARDSVVLLLLHPATLAELGSERATALLSAAGVRCVGPAGYVESLSLLAGAGAVITDACAVQEDASALGIACFTLLDATASTVTLTHGTNVLLGQDPSALTIARPSGWDPTPAAIPLWDGRAAERVADALVANYTLSPAVRVEDR